MRTKVKITMEVEFPEPVSFQDIQYTVEEAIAERLDAKASLIEMKLVDMDKLLISLKTIEDTIEEINSLLQSRDREFTTLNLNEDNFTLLLSREDRVDFLCMLRDNFKERQALLAEVLFDAGVL